MNKVPLLNVAHHLGQKDYNYPCEDILQGSSVINWITKWPLFVGPITYNECDTVLRTVDNNRE